MIQYRSLLLNCVKILALIIIFSVFNTGEAYGHFGVTKSHAIGMSVIEEAESDTQDNSQVINNQLASPPVIEIWYGPNQSFGQLGMPQNQINILGNVFDPNGITSLTFSLNGGSARALSIGPDGRRLVNQGDFNVEIFDYDSALVTGNNQIVITAKDGNGETSSNTVTVIYNRGNTWPLPYSVDWGSAPSISAVAQVVDGKWDLTASGVRTLELGYDRLIAIGDVTWDDYEVTVPVTMYTINGGAGIGVLMRWNGHTDNPVSGWQPKSGWIPYGSIGWYRARGDYIGDRLQIFGNNGDMLAEDFSGRKLEKNTPYTLKIRVETIPAQGALYAIKIWETSSAEPANWDLVGQADTSDPENGSILLLAHRSDVKFGDVVLEPIGIDNTDPQISNVQIKAGLTSAIVSWDTDEPTSGSVEYGPSTAYEYGSATDSAWVQRHSVLLTGLTSNSHYHFKIRSGDTQGNTSIDSDRVFDTQTPSPSSGIVSDDFNACNLDGSVWTFTDPVGDVTLGLTGSYTPDAWLSFDVPASSDHDIWINKYKAPRVMQSANNTDFEVEVKFESGLTEKNQTQGILVEESELDQNLLRFEFLNDGSNTKISATVFENGIPDVITKQTAAGQGVSPLYMLVSRVGDEWSLDYSLDGSFGDPKVITFTYPLVVTRIGAYAGNATNASLPSVPNAFLSETEDYREDIFLLQDPVSIQAAPEFAGFIDYFMETSAPVIPEDGERNDIDIAVIPSSAGSVTAIPDKSNYSCGEQVTLTASANPGWSFSHWGGDFSGSQNPDDLLMYGPREIDATFIVRPYTINVLTDGAGSVSKIPDKPEYGYGEVVQLLATPEPGWTFLEWSGDLIGNVNPADVTMDEDKTITAKFVKEEYTLDVITQGNGVVSVDPDQPIYYYGDQVELTAVADSGWSFSQWDGDLVSTANPIVVTMDGSKTMIADFVNYEISKIYLPIYFRGFLGN